MAKKPKQIDSVNKVEKFGAISRERRAVREKARKERARKKFFLILKNKIIAPFAFAHKKLEIERFLLRKTSRKFAKSISSKETRISNNAANLVSSLDSFYDTRWRLARKRLRTFHKRMENLEFLNGTRRKQIVGSTLAMFVAGMIIMGAFNVVTAYEYSFNGKVLGVVEEQQDVTEIMEVVNSQLTDEYDANIQLSTNDSSGIEFRRVVTSGVHVQSPDEVLTTLTYMEDITVVGYGIFVDGKRTSVVGSEKEAEEIIEELLADYTVPTSGYDYESVKFRENVEVGEAEVKLGSIRSKDEAKAEIIEGVPVEEGYVVAEGDTVKSISESVDVSEEKIEEENPEVDIDNLVVGETLNIVKKEPIVHVEVVANVETMREIPFETKTTEDNSMFLDTEEVSQEGENGEEKVSAKITFVNGEIVDEEIKSKTVIKEPVNKVVTVGTRALPATVASGTFINPFAAGSVSSPYGPRWGTFHNGVDLAGPTGSPILASDGGTVTYAAYDGSYGLKVEIAHGNGNSTLYAHCSEILVNVGDDVYQGQQIAKVGSTGYSTGPHVHFEVYLEGTRIDPATVIPI